MSPANPPPPPLPPSRAPAQRLRPLLPPLPPGAGAYAPARAIQPTDLSLDANEGPRSPVITAEALARVTCEDLRRYPSAAALERLLAQRLEVDPACVLVTAGGDDAIDRVCRAALRPGDVGLVHAPTFEMIPRAINMAGATVRSVEWTTGDFPIQAFLDQLRSSEVRLAAIVTPNNPTGLAVRLPDLQAAALVSERAGVLLMVDLAYIEFADGDPTRLIAAIPNVVVIRTLSKAWGLAGLRVGYAVGPAAIIDRLRAQGGPYAVATPSLAAAYHRLKTPGEDFAAGVVQVRAERIELESLLTTLGAPAGDSQGNFAFARAGNPERSIWLRDALAGLGIAVRIFPGRPLLEDAVRITCPADAGDMARLTAALRSTLAPRALVIDLDSLPGFASPAALTAQDAAAAARLGLPPATMEVKVLSRRPAAELAGVLQVLAPGRPARAISPEEFSREPGGAGWLIGARPESRRLARSANFVPIALAPAGDGLSRELLRSGFARVIDRLEALQSVLP